MSEEIKTMDDLAKEIDASFDNFRDADAEGWDKCEQYKEDGSILELTVDGITKAGVVVTVEGLRGFVPASHLSLNRVEDLNDFLGKTIKVQVIEVDEINKKLILSSRKLLQDQVAAEKMAKIKAIVPGSIIEGTVDSLKPYGAFIKINESVTGLVHISQIATKRINDPAQVLKKGQTVQAKVLNTNDGKLSLSIRAIEEDEIAKKEAEEKNIEIPEAEEIGQSMGALLKGFKFE